MNEHATDLPIDVTVPSIGRLAPAQELYEQVARVTVVLEERKFAIGEGH
jgi:hypothetical protein